MKTYLPKQELSGHYKLIVRRGGEVRLETDWFDNLITDAGLNALGESVKPGRYAMVGTDNSTPVVTDIALGAQVASKDGDAAPSASRTSGIVTSSPRYGWERRTFTFPQGTVVGNIAEVGVGWSTTAVFSRSLVSPAVSITAIDELTLVYELRMYLPTTNVTGSVTIDSVVYNYEIAPLWASTANTAGQDRGWTPSLLTLGASARVWSNWNDLAGRYGAWIYGPPCVLQDITDTALRQTLGGTVSPTGSLPVASSISNAAYVSSTLECQFTFNFSVAVANGSGGIRGIVYTGLFGTYQCILDGTIPKDATKVLTLTFQQSWARRP